MPPLPRVAIIGAGSSGIAGLKTLVDAGLPVVAYEKSDRIGGNWVYGNRNGVSSAYRSLHVNSSRRRMEYSDFPMPTDYPDFPHHSQVARYFDTYVDHFGIRERILFGTGVAHAGRIDDGTWQIRTDAGASAYYDAVVVANGHHWDPRWPQPPFPGAGSFAGEQIHSHHYTVPEPYRGMRVVVLGMGNSAMDIAAELSFHAEAVFLSARRGAYIIPKYIRGRPLDAQQPDRVRLALQRLPFRLRSRLSRADLMAAVGDHTRYGLPAPDHPFLGEHPTISDTILSRITHGKVIPKPNIALLDGHRVHFTDGSCEPADVVIYATGYTVTFPFFDPGFISAPGNVIDLYRRIFHPDIEGVHFLGLLQPLGATMPLAEAQGRWLGEYLRGRYLLPPRSQMLADIAAEKAANARRYVTSPRHTMQIDDDLYLWKLARELRAGRARAAAAGYPLPVPGRVHARAAGGNAG